MDLLPTEEQQQIIDTAASFLASEFPVRQLVSLPGSEPRVTRNHLQQIANLGWFGIGLPDEFDGVGYGLPEEALLCVELGRNLMPPSLLGSVLGARIAALSGSATHLSPVLNGETGIALACARNTRSSSIGATVDGDFLVYEAQDADLVLFADDNGAALVTLSALRCLTTESCIDETLDLSIWRASGSSSVCYVPAHKDPVYLRGAVLVSAMLLGIAEATLARSVEYAKEREQFGKPIGSFQAIKHYCAEMAIRCESVRALLHHASINLHRDSPAAPFDVHALKALAADAAQTNAAAAVQIHGGMGYTREMDIHLFVKRAQVLGSLYGSERLHLQKLLSASAPQ
jgi:alkylation response protein AidB-like acyl-CoA dehydrogenase